MGRDKALLPWGSATLLDHTLDRLRAVSSEVRILSGAVERYTDREVPALVDVKPAAGPLAALAAGLQAARDARCAGALLLAVDLPFVSPTLLAGLATGLVQHDVSAPLTASGPEPLCAAYGVGCLPAVHERLAAEDYKMTSFWNQVRTRLVGGEELRAFGDPDELFANVNLPEDYARAVALSRR